MNQKRVNYKRLLYGLMTVSFVVRLFLAGSLELGNDEVYYRLYALFPALSYFDHPLMVGLVIRIFSINLLLTSELFLRLGAVVLGTANLYIAFRIGKLIGDDRTGFLAALLYTASVYTFVIAGIFILPDAPQSFFWLLSLYAMLRVLPNPDGNHASKQMILFGLYTGLGFLSKYTALFLWFGAALYILFYRRDWLKKPSLWLSLLVSFVLSLPVLIWNIQNDFISITFHGERVDMVGYGLNFTTFFRELAGEFFYNNPVNFVLILAAVIAFVRKEKFIDKEKGRLLLAAGLPVILIFILFSLFRATLPHWTAPGYTTLLFLAAARVSKRMDSKIPVPVVTAAGLLFLVLIFGFVQIKTGLFYHDESGTITQKGSNDPSLDMYGYRQAGRAFAKLVADDFAKGKMKKDAFLTGDNWFPLANFDYYAASPLGMKSLAIGPLYRIHEYARINRKRGGFHLGSDAYYLTDTRYFRPPSHALSAFFQSVESADTIPIDRGGQVAKYVLVYRLKNLLKIPPDPFKKPK